VNEWQEGLLGSFWQVRVLMLGDRRQLQALHVDPDRSPALTGIYPETLPLSANAAEVEQA
jgi:hypothetical protein